MNNIIFSSGILTRLLASFILILFSNWCFSAEWQWSVKVKGFVSDETSNEPDAFLWIPPTCPQIRAVVIGQHNMSEEDLFENDLFRRGMEELGFTVVWITPGISMNWDVKQGVQEYIEQLLNDLSESSGYSELRFVPIIPVGHSAYATYPWNFAAWNPERTLAILSLHGDAPRTNLTGYGRENLEWGRTRNIDGIPGLMIEGEYEWWEARVTPALAFRMMYPQSCISFYCDVGQGHFDVSDELVNYMLLFLKKTAQFRLPEELPIDRRPELISVDPRQGWLAQRWQSGQGERPKAAPYNQYKGDTHDAFWYFDEEIAQETERRYAAHQGKKEQYIGFIQDEKMIPFDENAHARMFGRFLPGDDGLTFHLKAIFTDTLRTQLSNDHSSAGEISLDRICGPVEKINDTTFIVRFYRMGLKNSRRTDDIWLVASHPGDKEYNSAVQQLNIKIPYPNKEGKMQKITFAELPDINNKTKSLDLNAVSDSNLPVYFYIKEGPAEINDTKLILTAIPPRSKYPIKVTVVAWQYGIAGKFQTAEPVEHSFYVTNEYVVN